MNHNDTRYFLYSIILHISLVLIFTVKLLVFPSIRPELIRSVRVDFVDMPDKLPTEAPPGVEKQHKEDVKKEVEEKKAPVEEKKVAKEDSKKTKPEPAKKEEGLKKKDEDTSPKDQQSSALARLQAMAKIKKMKADKAGAEGATYKGNQLSTGSALTGVEKLQHDAYMENLDLHIRKNWQLPEWLAKKALTAAMMVRFDENGQVLDRRFIRKSGNEIFDKEVEQTIEASIPFPAPPESLISYFKVHGIELRFPE